MILPVLRTSHQWRNLLKTSSSRRMILEALQMANAYNVMATPIIRKENALHELETCTAVEEADHINSVEHECGVIEEEKQRFYLQRGQHSRNLPLLIWR